MAAILAVLDMQSADRALPPRLAAQLRLQRESVAVDLRVDDTALEGEIVCVDWNGHSQFNRLIYGYGTHQKSCRGERKD